MPSAKRGHAPATASKPEPKDGAIHPNTWAQLSWVPGSTADSPDVELTYRQYGLRTSDGTSWNVVQRNPFYGNGERTSMSM